MSKNKDTNNNFINDDDYEYEKELAKKRRDIEKEHEEAMQRAIEQQAQKERQERLNREKQNSNDKIELLRLKNGVVDEEDSTIQEVHEEQIELHGKAKIANIWYHNKVWILFGIFILITAIVIVYDISTKEKADITVLMTANNGLAERSDELEEFFEKYTPDLDGNGYVHVSVIIMPQSEADIQQQQGVNQTKLVANLQLADAIMVITDEDTDEAVKEIMVDDLTDEFKGNEYIDEMGLRLDMEKAGKALKYENMPKGVHISLRKPVETTGDSLEKMQDNYNKSYEVFKAITEDLCN